MSESVVDDGVEELMMDRRTRTSVVSSIGFYFSPLMLSYDLR